MTSIGFLGRKILCINNNYYNNIFLVCVLQQRTISCKNGPMKSLPPQYKYRFMGPSTCLM